MKNPGMRAEDRALPVGAGAARPTTLSRFGWLLTALVATSAYPVLFVYFHNIKEASLAQALSPIALFIAVGMAAWLFFSFLSGGMEKGALVALLFLLVFMNYGLIEPGFRKIAPDWRWWRIAPAFLFLLVGLALALRVFAAKAGSDAGLFKMTMAIGLVNLTLILFNTASGIVVLAGTPRVERLPAMIRSPRVEGVRPTGPVGKRPNFYFFVFDEYARQDVLKKYSGYDNTSFLKGLEDKGFNISYSSDSNTIYTEVSIGNLLHYSYVFRTKLETKRGIARPPMLEAFKKAGYKTYVLTPNYRFASDLLDVELKATSVLTALDISKTALEKSFVIYLQGDWNESLRADRLNLLKQAAEIVMEEVNEPKFLFFHFMGPHEPFIFNEAGDPVAYEDKHNWANPRHYVGQLRFLSKRFSDLADRIIATDPQAVVLLQSDHGARWFAGMLEKERSASLNALYVRGDKLSIEGLSTVNTLRLALNHALGLNLRPLEDET